MPLRAEKLTPVPVARPSWLERVLLGKKNTRVLDIRYVSQRPYQSLCWAACGEMVLSTVGRSVAMCAFAGWRTGRDCCGNQADPGCDRTCWPEDAYKSLGLPYRIVPAPLSADSVTKEIVTHGRPVQIVLHYPTWRHTALIVGVKGPDEFVVHDPLFGQNRICSFAFLLSAYGDRLGAWNKSYHSLGVANGNS